MSRRWLLSLLCLSAVVVFAQLSSARNGLTVNESATKFLVQDQTVVVLEVVNPATKNLPVHLILELLDPQDSSEGRAVRNVDLQPGVNRLTIPLSFTAAQLNKDQDEDLLWYRLRYRIDPATDVTSAPDAASGVISLSEIDTPDIFVLEVGAPAETHRGARHYTHIRALHPITAKPVKDVSVNVELKLDSSPEETLRGSAVTDAEGYALVSLSIPNKIDADEGELTVVAQHGGFVKEASKDIELNDNAQIMVTTDKPIYQPGQPLHVRALMFDAAKHAAANATATLKITDPENTTVFQTELTTSRFGVANADWTIPENTGLGNYEIRVEVDDENYDESPGVATVKISRYDLPNFTVSVKPDHPFYLPQQDAVVEVQADYLFGQPVKRGHVRVVREQERSWNYAEQKWDIEEGDNYEGETNDDGRFVAHVNLQTDHKELADRDYSRFEDLSYRAYFTDPTTNRTEQRKFDLRVTKDPIHIYVSEGRYRQARGFPMEFFVATAYADGTPVPCDVTINELDPEDGALGPVLGNIHTNKYGIAKISGIMLRDKGYSSGSLRITAQNAGAVGHHTESFYYSRVPLIRVATERALYRAGEPIKVNITASEPKMNLFVDISRDSNIIESRSLTLTNGAASFTLRYRPEFRDEVTISAFSKAVTDPNDYNGYSYGSRTVLFPRDRDLKLNLRWDHADYKPGDDATVDFRILTADGRPAMSALGVVIFDRAVEERARTDQDFGGRFGFYGSFSSWRGYDDQVGGITRKELQRLDLKQPLPEGMDLVAELLLGTSYVQPEFFGTEGFAANHAEVFSKLTSLSLKPITDILESQYKNSGAYPENTDVLRRVLFETGVDSDELRDPWGTPYTKVFSIDKDDSVLEIVSAGPDKIFTTKDDFTVNRIARPYFRFTGEAINRAVARFHARNGGFIRDAAALKNELQFEGIDFGSLRDPWGQPYDLSFTTRQEIFNVDIRSSGPDKRFQSPNSVSDDFTLWIAGIDYLTETRALVEQALGNYFRATNTLPANDVQLQQALANIDQSRLRDPWGHRYYAVYKVTSRYADRASLRTMATYGQSLKARTEITPVTQEITSMTLRSNGEDGNKGTADDFDAATFSQLTGEESSQVQATKPAPQQVFFAGAKGAIKGTVTDPNGGAVASAKVKATLQPGSAEFETETDDSGRFLLRNLPVGLYTLHCDAMGFSSAVITEVPVSSSNITTLDFSLQVGTVAATVNITAGASATVDTSQASIATTVTEHRPVVYFGKPAQLSTPRLREYFPETLVWQPALETDQQGRAQLKFKLADNITTWKMSVIGSTEDGELGSAEAEIKSFQPFFDEHDPPRVLTEGDQISLPVVLRNYLERAQTVDLEIKPESWFELQGSAHQTANVPAGDAARQTFDLKAVASVKDGKQRITARSSEASDAIEKPVTVHPDGEENTQTASDVFAADATLNIDLPVSVIPGSMQAELKIYPNLMAHVVESIEGILERPHGCGEQTISSTYPSVLFLRRNKLLAKESQLSRKAQRYAELGYQRLLNYRSDDGGFTYWGRGEADFALTAYALRFLQDAREFVRVDDDIISAARTWLIKRQQTNGSWLADGYSNEAETERRTTLLTAYVARVLAMTESRHAIDNAAGKKPAVTNVSPELRRALGYLATRMVQLDEPYLIASYALAAIDAGDQPAAALATTKLRTLARSEGDTTYWALETNTPFYGWGLAGRVETTALAVQALTRYAKTQSDQANGTPEPLVRSGLLFLLRSKDRYGVWYSTQATINVLDTLLALLAEDTATADQTKGAAVEIIVNGVLATSLTLPTANQTGALIRADISRFLRGGTNRVELRRASSASIASIQLVANYYVPWLETGTVQAAPQKPLGSSALRLTTTFDKTTAKVNEEISCHVKAERVGHSGYGMLLAEIGLPPGADVDRASLETAMKGSDWSFSQYDILPDRVVVYLWPRAGGVAFDFKFRPRFALNAKAAPAIVYDYYNPDARVVVAPATFVVK